MRSSNSSVLRAFSLISSSRVTNSDAFLSAEKSTIPLQLPIHPSHTTKLLHIYLCHQEAQTFPESAKHFYVHNAILKSSKWVSV